MSSTFPFKCYKLRGKLNIGYIARMLTMRSDEASCDFRKLRVFYVSDVGHMHVYFPRVRARRLTCFVLFFYKFVMVAEKVDMMRISK